MEGRFRASGRVEVDVGDAVVDRLQAGGAHIGQVRGLHGGGLAGEQSRPAVARVHRQVHQDVDAVGAYRFGQGGVVEVVRLPPMAHPAGALVGEAVLEVARRIGEDLEPALVVVLQDGQHEAGHRVHPEVGRDIPEANFPLRFRGIGVGNRGPEVVEFPLAQPAVLGGDLGVGEGGAVVEGEEVVGDEVAVVLAQVDPLAVAGDGQVELALVEVGVAQVRVRRGEVGLEADRLEHGGLGQVGEPRLAVEVAEVGVGLVVVGADADRLLERLEALAVAVQAEQDVAEVVERLGEVGADLERAAEVAGGVVVPADGVHEVAHAEARLGVVRVGLQALGEPAVGLLVPVRVEGQLAQVGKGLREVRFLRQRGVEGLGGAGDVALRLAGQAEVVERLGEHGLKGQGFFQRRDRFLPPIESAQGIGLVKPGGGRVGAGGDDLVRRVHRLPGIAEAEMDGGDLVPGRGEVGLEKGGGVERAQGLGPMSPKLVQVAEVVQGDGVGGVEFQGAVVRRLGLGGAPHVLEGVAEVDMEEPFVRGHGHRGLKVRQAQFGVAGEVLEHAEEVAGLGVGRFGGEDGEVGLAGLGEHSLLVERDSLR